MLLLVLTIYFDDGGGGGGPRDILPSVSNSEYAVITVSAVSGMGTKRRKKILLAAAYPTRQRTGSLAESIGA